MIKENILRIQKELKELSISCGRTEQPVLIAVSKTMPVRAVEEAYACGIRDFGENRVKELLEKQAQLPEDIRWHMIGHLQSNKVRQILPAAYLIHSIDSINLSDVIEHEASKQKRVVRGLLEVNVAMEESKFGFTPDSVIQALERFSQYRHLKIEGLMTVAPYVENPEMNRPVFRKLKEIWVDIQSKSIDNVSMKYLSMGMTGDYPVALEEGADFLRIGTGIFGGR